MKRRQSTFSLFSFQDIITGLCGIIILIVLVMLVDLADTRTRTNGSPPVHADADNPIVAIQAEIERLRAQLADLQKQTRLLIIVQSDDLPPEQKEKLKKEADERQKRLAALLSQIKLLRQQLTEEKARDEEQQRAIRQMEEAKIKLENALAEAKNKHGVTLIRDVNFYKTPVFIDMQRDRFVLYRPFEKGTQPQTFSGDGELPALRQALNALDTTVHTIILLARPSRAREMMRLAEMVKTLGFSYGRDPLEEDAELSFQ